MPITNQQNVDFLNINLDKIRAIDSDVYLDDRLILKLIEKIRGYKPIEFVNGSLLIKVPMHTSCTVLLIIGLGAAKSYASYCGKENGNAYREPKQD